MTGGFIMKKFFTACGAILLALALTACSSGDTSSSQTRNDLTAEHFKGLTSGMARKDVEDLVGAGDESLGKHESLQTYGLADGTTAILRYWDDKLVGAYIRGTDTVETSLFDMMTGNDQTNDQNTTNNPSETESQSKETAEHITGETMKDESTE